MADKISDEERRLIDEAIARGATRVIPQGERSMAFGPLSWREATDRTFEAMRRNDKIRAISYIQSISSLTVEKKIRMMVEEGKTNYQIGKSLNISAAAVAQRLHRMGVIRKKSKGGNHVPFGE